MLYRYMMTLDLVVACAIETRIAGLEEIKVIADADERASAYPIPRPTYRHGVVHSYSTLFVVN